MSSNSSLGDRSRSPQETVSEDSAVLTQEPSINGQVVFIGDIPHVQLSVRSETKGLSFHDVTLQTPVNLSKAVHHEPVVKTGAGKHHFDTGKPHAMRIIAQDPAIISVGKPLGSPDSATIEVASPEPKASNRNEVVIAIGSPASETAKKPRFKALVEAQQMEAAIRRAYLAVNRTYHVAQALAVPGPRIPQKPLNHNAAPFNPQDQGQKKATDHEQAHTHALVEGLRRSSRHLRDSQ